jgi:hypothetical protein
MEMGANEGMDVSWLWKQSPLVMLSPSIVTVGSSDHPPSTINTHALTCKPLSINALFLYTSIRFHRMDHLSSAAGRELANAPHLPDLADHLSSTI